LQWALLIRIRPGSTPRDLAWDLSRSVFGTTAEVYRLLVRGLVSVAGDPAPVRDDPPGQRALASLSFLRAVSVKRGDAVPTIRTTSGLSGGAVRGDAD
jgi:hypothetical protein